MNSQYEWLNECTDFKLFQDDIRSVLREGRQLLSNLEASKAVEGAAAEDRDISQDKERVNRHVNGVNAKLFFILPIIYYEKLRRRA